MDPDDLVALHLRIDGIVKKIMKIVKINNDQPPPFYQDSTYTNNQPQTITKGKIYKEDIPELVLLLSELILTDKKIRAEQLTDKMKKMYAYVMMHYNLYPIDETEKRSYKKLFDNSVKLLVHDPRLKKKANRSSSFCNCCWWAV